MGKEARQGILLIVIILAAVVLIDIGNSHVSGKAIEETLVADESIATEENSGSPSSASAGGGSSGGMGPTIIAPPGVYCDVTDWTQHVLSRIPGAVDIRMLYDPQDSTYQTAIVETADINNNVQWSLYDFGADGKLSNDDRVYAGGPSSLSGGVYNFITSDAGLTNRKLFWIERGFIPGITEIKSCDLPTCNNRITEVRVQSSSLLSTEFLPSLTRDRIYMQAFSTIRGGYIVSCSRNQANNDWCGYTLANFLIHVTQIPVQFNQAVVRDAGFSYFDVSTNRETFFSIGNDAVVQLPVGSYQHPMLLLGSGTGFLLRFINISPTRQRTELLAVDFNTGQVLGIVDTIALEMIIPEFITLRGVFFQNYLPMFPVLYQSRSIGQSTKIVWSEMMQPSIIPTTIIPARSGNVIAMRSARPPSFPEIISFDCTP